MKKKLIKLNWDEIWKQFNKLCDGLEYAFDNITWEEQKIIFYSIVNINLNWQRKLDGQSIKKIERSFNRWFKNESFTDWPKQKKFLQTKIENIINNTF